MSIFIAEVFDNYMQQDAHEFLNYLLNTVADLLTGEAEFSSNQSSSEFSVAVTLRCPTLITDVSIIYTGYRL